MKNTDTIFTTRDGQTAYQFRHNGGCVSGTTTLTVDQTKAAIKGVNLPTSRQRAEGRRDAIKAAEAL